MPLGSYEKQMLTIVHHDVLGNVHCYVIAKVHAKNRFRLWILTYICHLVMLGEIKHKFCIQTHNFITIYQHVS